MSGFSFSLVFFFLSSFPTSILLLVSQSPASLTWVSRLSLLTPKDDGNGFIYIQPLGVFCPQSFFLEEETCKLAQCLFFFLTSCFRDSCLETAVALMKL